MSIFIILVLIFVYFYCSTLERAIESMGNWESYDNYYDSNHRRDHRLWRYSSSVWDLSKFE